jgi:hypothetical protein
VKRTIHFVGKAFFFVLLSTCSSGLVSMKADNTDLSQGKSQQRKATIIEQLMAKNPAAFFQCAAFCKFMTSREASLQFPNSNRCHKLAPLIPADQGSDRDD